MTGYGTANDERGGHAIVVEVRSVNSKQREVRVRLPSALSALEPRLREATQARTHRGRIDVSVNWEKKSQESAGYTVNESALRGVLDAWQTMSEQFGLAGEPPRPEHVIRVPGVLEASAGEELDLETLGDLTVEVLGGALDEYTRAREREGARLIDDLRQRAREIRERVEQVEQRLEGASERQAQALRERIEPLLAEVPLDEARLAQEVAILAQKADVTEELVRLAAHLNRLDTLVADGSTEIGRPLEFLVQELRREVTTLGVKGSDPDVDEHVLAIKAELEKIREQAANLE